MLSRARADGDVVLKKRTIFRNSVWNVLGFWAGVVMLLISTPVYIKFLGIAQFGLYTLLVAIISPLTILSSGIGPATVKYIAEFESKGKIDQCVNLVATILSFNLILGGIGLAVSWFAADWLASGVFRIEEGLHREAVIAFRMAGLIWFLTQIGATFRGVTEGLQDYRTISLATVAQQGLTYGFGMAILAVYPHITGLLYWNAIIGVGFILFWFLRARTHFPGLRFHPSLDRFSIRKTFHFSSWLFINSFFGVSASNTDRFLLGIYLSTGAVGIYSVARKIQDTVRGVALPVINTLFPAASAVSHIHGESERFILDYGWKITSISGCIYGIAFVLGPEFLHFWVGDKVAGAAGPVMRILMLTVLLELPSAIIGQYILGHGLTRLATLSNVFTSSITITLMFLWIRGYGMLGVASSGLIGLLVTRPLFHVWVFRRYFGTVDRWEGCLRDTYGVLLSIVLGGFGGYLVHGAASTLLGRTAGFAASLILSPLAIGLLFVASESLLMGHRKRVIELIGAIFAKLVTLSSRLAAYSGKAGTPRRRATPE